MTGLPGRFFEWLLNLAAIALFVAFVLLAIALLVAFVLLALHAGSVG